MKKATLRISFHRQVKSCAFTECNINLIRIDKLVVVPLKNWPWPLFPIVPAKNWPMSLGVTMISICNRSPKGVTIKEDNMVRKEQQPLHVCIITRDAFRSWFLPMLEKRASVGREPKWGLDLVEERDHVFMIRALETSGEWFHSRSMWHIHSRSMSTVLKPAMIQPCTRPYRKPHPYWSVKK